MDQTGTDIVGIIFAGGRSSRMGFDKAFLPLHGRPMIVHVIDRMAPQVTALALNTTEARVYAAFGCVVVPDRVPGRPGPLAGLDAGLAWANERGAKWLATAPCDAPCVPRGLIERLRAACGVARPVLARSPDSLEPMFGLWPVACLDAVAAALRSGEAGPRRIATELGAVIVDIPLENGEMWWRNINSSDDATAMAVDWHDPT